MAFFRHSTQQIDPLLLQDLKEQQQKLREQIVFQPLTGPLQTIAGCDSSFIGDQILSVFVVLSWPDLTELEMQFHLSKVELPYIPGYLAFREVPNLLQTFQKLHHMPDIIMVDGHGVMHPRRLGIATHLGIVLNKPTIGVAKKKLVGKFKPVGEEPGDFSIVTDHDEEVGVALRSKLHVKPIFVSAGQLCDLPTALGITQQTLRKHKLPEPTRIADKYSKELKLTLKL